MEGESSSLHWAQTEVDRGWRGREGGGEGEREGEREREERGRRAIIPDVYAAIIVELKVCDFYSTCQSYDS